MPRNPNWMRRMDAGHDESKDDKPKGKVGVFPDVDLQGPAEEYEPLRVAPTKPAKKPMGSIAKGALKRHGGAKVETRDVPRQRRSTAQVQAERVESAGKRKRQTGLHAERLLGIDPATFDPHAKRTSLFNMKVNDYFLCLLINAADREGITVSEFVKMATEERARKLGVE